MLQRAVFSRAMARTGEGKDIPTSGAVISKTLNLIQSMPHQYIQTIVPAFSGEEDLGDVIVALKEGVIKLESKLDELKQNAEATRRIAGMRRPDFIELD